MFTVTKYTKPSPDVLHSAEVPPGTYVVGDPCYSVPNELWMAWLEAADYEVQSREHVLAANINGHLTVGVSTACGDGVYPASDGAMYGVDAGLLGLVPIEVAKDVQDNLNAGLTTTVTLDKPAVCYFDNGTVHLGDLTIWTGDDLDGDPWSYADN